MSIIIFSLNIYIIIDVSFEMSCKNDARQLTVSEINLAVLHDYCHKIPTTYLSSKLFYYILMYNCLLHLCFLQVPHSSYSHSLDVPTLVLWAWCIVNHPRCIIAFQKVRGESYAQVVLACGWNASSFKRIFYNILYL